MNHPLLVRMSDSPVAGLSVIIINWNTGSMALPCLESLFKERVTEGLQVIFVDNASSDRSVERVRQQFPETEIIECSENLGFAKAANLGLSRARGEYILIAHPDVEFQEHAIDRMISFLSATPRAGVVGANLRYPDGTYNSTSIRGYSLERITLEFAYFSLRPVLRLSQVALKKVEERMRAYYWDHHSTTESKVIWNACMMFRRDALEEVGAFGDEFFVWYADVDWCYRASAAGWKAFYLENASVVHYERQSAAHLESELVRYKCDGALVARKMAADKQLLFRRHHSLFLRIVDSLFENLAVLLERLRRSVRNVITKS